MEASSISSIVILPLAIVGAFVLVVMALMVLGLPFSPMWMLQEKRFADKVASTPCPFCESVFGLPEVEVARQELKRIQKAVVRRQKSTTRVIYNWWWDVVCPSCKRKSSFDPSERSLIYPYKRESSVLPLKSNSNRL